MIFFFFYEMFRVERTNSRKSYCLCQSTGIRPFSELFINYLRILSVFCTFYIVC